MTITRECERFREGGFAERYAPGKLSVDEAEAYEAHFLTCDHCQHDLLLAAGVRKAWATAVAPRQRWPTWVAGIGLAAAAGIAGILLLPGKGPPAEIGRLGAVLQAPVYLGIPVRAGGSTSADSLFDVAMRDYTAERFREAEDGLRRALAAGIDPPAALFFLSSSELMTDQPATAADRYAELIARGDTPYLGEAHYYRAKALLRLGRVEEAAAELGRAAAGGGVMADAARALQDSVRSASPR